jgi:SulP family sulfate permease
LLLFTFKAVSKVKAVRIIRREDGRFEFAPLPKKMPSNEITTIEFLGTVYFATVYSYDDLIPDFKETKNGVLILNMRGRQNIFETSVEFTEKFVPKVHAAGNLFMICNVADTVLKQIKATEAYELIGEENIFPDSPIIGASLEEAWQAAEKWIAAQQEVEVDHEERHES